MTSGGISFSNPLSWAYGSPVLWSVLTVVQILVVTIVLLATKVIGRVEQLPGPLIIVAKTADPAFSSEFLTRLHATRAAAPHQPFAGFTAYRNDLVTAFFDRVDRATALAPF